MIRITFPAICLIAFGTLTTNAQKIVIAKGQQLEAVTSMKMNMTIDAMGQNIDMENATTALVETKGVYDTGYVFENKVTRFKMKSGAMGQNITFDSDKPEDMNSEIGGTFKKLIGSTQTYGVSKQGKIVSISQMSTEDAAINQSVNFVGSLTKGQPYPFLFPGAGKKLKAGDTWKDSTGTNDSSKTVYTYTLKSDAGDKFTVGVSGVIKLTTVTKQQGMDIDIILEGTTKGDAVFTKATGILETNTSVSDMKGTMGVMGQSTPISVVCNVTIDVKKR